jgi:hypothetical protein
VTLLACHIVEGRSEFDQVFRLQPRRAVPDGQARIAMGRDPRESGNRMQAIGP